MLLWMTLLAGLLSVTTILVVAMLRAERHARRNLFRKLDLSEETIEFLMARNGDVRSELTLVRILPAAAPEPETVERTAPPSAAEASPYRRHPTIRLVHPLADEADASESDRDQPDPQRHSGA